MLRNRPAVFKNCWAGLVVIKSGSTLTRTYWKPPFHLQRIYSYAHVCAHDIFFFLTLSHNRCNSRSVCICGCVYVSNGGLVGIFRASLTSHVRVIWAWCHATLLTLSTLPAFGFSLLDARKTRPIGDDDDDRRFLETLLKLVFQTTVCTKSGELASKKKNNLFCFFACHSTPKVQSRIRKKKRRN